MNAGPMTACGGRTGVNARRKVGARGKDKRRNDGSCGAEGGGGDRETSRRAPPLPGQMRAADRLDAFV